MEQPKNNPQSLQGDQQQRGLLDKMKNNIGTAVLFAAAAVGGDLVMAPDAVAQTGPSMEQQETWESKFQKLLLKNENVLNQELVRMGISTVRLGQPAGMRAKCGINFGVYSSSGEHIADFACSKVEFENHHMFMDFARTNIIPKLSQNSAPSRPSFQQTAPGAQPYAYPQEQIRVVTPESLLKAALFSRAAADYFNANELTISTIRDGSGLVACVVRRKGSALPAIEVSDFCYNTKTAEARFDYDSIKDAITVKTKDFDGTLDGGTFKGFYSKNGVLQGFR